MITSENIAGIDTFFCSNTRRHHICILHEIYLYIHTREHLFEKCRFKVGQPCAKVRFAPSDSKCVHFKHGKIKFFAIYSGLMGKEGRQAVRNSDYAFGRFRFLKRALLVHGHYFYVRITMLIQYFFFKNVAFITAQLYYAFFSAFSAQVRP